jgi:hypothetical protein
MMNRTGVWDATTVNDRIMRRAFMFTRPSKSLTEQPVNGKIFALWSDDEWSLINDLIDQMETDTSPTGFNKHKLTIPHLGKHRIVWLWREDTCPQDADKELIFHEFTKRLHKMSDFCNVRYTTDESPATLFLEAVVQWFETGGKCHVFGCVMTAYIGHPTNFSLGRGVTRKLQNGLTAEIKPGDPMLTGWMTLMPSDLGQYDVTRRSIIVETWRANVMRFRYPSGIALMPILDKAVLDLADETQWYEKIKAIDKYTAVPLPKLKFDRRAWQNKIITGIYDDEEIDTGDYNGPEIELDESAGEYQEFLDLEEQEDEEVKFLETLHSERNAVQSTGSLFQSDEGEEEIDKVDTSSTEQDQWVLPRTRDAIGAWEVDLMHQVCNLPLPAETKEELRKQVGRLFGVAKPALYAEAEDI